MKRVRKHRSWDSPIFTWQSGGSSWGKLPGRRRSRSLARNPICSFLVSLSITEANIEGALLRRPAVGLTVHGESQKGESCFDIFSLNLCLLLPQISRQVCQQYFPNFSFLLPVRYCPCHLELPCWLGCPGTLYALSPHLSFTHVLNTQWNPSFVANHETYGAE